MLEKVHAVDDLVHFENAPLTVESTPIDPATIVKGEALTERTHVLYADDQNELTVGVWESDAGAWFIETAEDEYIRVLDGEIRLTDENGQSRDYGPGDSFFVPRKFKGTWESCSPVRKIFISLLRRSD